MTYEEARTYIREIAGRGSVYGLLGIKSLMAELFDVQERLKIIHIAGTNGKGSVGAFLSAALMEAGYRIGRYTSPAVFSPLEVWQINGVFMTTEEYSELVSQVKCACGILLSKGMAQPTVFEVETAMAFCYFYQKKCDIVLLETGLGGETDATNLICHPLCSVITSISRDHMQFLGETIGEIAAAKAGIIKHGCPVVTGFLEQEALAVLREKAKREEAALYMTDLSQALDIEESAEEIRYRYREADGKETKIRLPMGGSYQIENSLLAMKVLRELLKIPADLCARGLEKAVWRGRFEIIGREPLFVIDGAHNIGAAEKLKETIQKDFTNKRITYIIGVLADKEYRKMLEILLPFANRVYTVTPDHPRALPAEMLRGEAIACITGMAGEEKEEKTVCRPDIYACKTVDEAVDLALDWAAKEDVILAFGSLSYLDSVVKRKRLQ